MGKIGRIFKLGFLLILSFNGFTQTNLDSLHTVWKNQNLTDTTRARALLSYIYSGPFRTSPDSAILLSKQLYEFSRDSYDSIGMVRALNLRGYSLFRVGDYTGTLTNYEKGLKIAERIGDKTGAADILLRTGYVYHDNEDYIKAINYYERSLKLYEETHDLGGKSNIYNEYGNIYLATGDLDKALEYYQKGLEIHDLTNNEFAKSAIYSNMGNLYVSKDELDKAILYLEKALSIEEAKGGKLGIASALGGLGNAYLERGELKKALEFLQRSLKICEEIKDVQGGIATLLDLGDTYLELGQYSKAIGAFEKSLSRAEQIGDLGNQEYASEGLYNSYRQLGNPTKALNFHEKMIAITDSLQDEETVMKLQQLEFSKQVVADSLLQVEKDLQVKMAHEREVRIKDRNRNIAVGVGVLFLLLSAGFFSRWRYVKKSKAIIEKEKNRSENLLLNILPAEIAEELKEKGEAKARDFDMVSILFTDFKGFTEQSAKVSAVELIDEINSCFKSFDLICEKYGIEKIKTIGDAYMAAGGLPVPAEDSVLNTVLAGLEMQEFMSNRIKEKKAGQKLTFEMRLGIHTGPVVAGIVGIKKFQYDIWGDTVNTASRMESNGEVGHVNISQHTYELLKENNNFTFTYRGKINAKGKGEIDMWFVDRG